MLRDHGPPVAGTGGRTYLLMCMCVTRVRSWLWTDLANWNLCGVSVRTGSCGANEVCKVMRGVRENAKPNSS
mgnify:CR=1 FL=1